MIHLEKLTSGYLELKTGSVEKDTLISKEFGRVYLIRHNGILLRINLDHLSAIKKLTFDQNEFDQNLIEWQSKVKEMEDRRVLSQIQSSSQPKLDPKFWETGYDIAMKFNASSNPLEKGTTKENLGGHTEKDIQIFTHKKLDPEFWRIGVLRSQSTVGFYLYAPRDPPKPLITWLGEIFGSEIMVYLYALMGILIFISIIFFVIYLFTK